MEWQRDRQSRTMKKPDVMTKNRMASSDLSVLPDQFQNTANLYMKSFISKSDIQKQI